MINPKKIKILLSCDACGVVIDIKKIKPYAVVEGIEKRQCPNCYHIISYKMKSLKVKIKCLECETIQDAKVKQSIPFWIYEHTCIKCNYEITESDFTIVQKGAK